MATNLLRVVDSFNKSDRIPASFPAATVAFIHHLINTTQSIDHPLKLFLLLNVSQKDVEDQLLKAAHPAERQRLLQEVLELDEAKEKAVFDGDFDRAATLLSKCDAVRDQISPVEIQPSHVLTALKSLGYSGELPA